METEDYAADLIEYARLDGCELGEYLTGLCNLSYSCKESYGASEKFAEAFADELKTQLEFLRNNCKVVEVTEQQTVKYKKIEWTK